MSDRARSALLRSHPCSAGRSLRRSIKRHTRPLRHASLALTLRALSWAASKLPLSWCQIMGALLGRSASHLARRSARHVTRRLLLVGPALKRDPDELEKLARRHWVDLGRRAGEWLAGPRALSLFWASPEVERSLERAYADAQTRGLLVLTAHYGHWELLGAWLSARGFDFLAIASLPPRGPFGAWLNEHRAQLGVRVIHPRGGARSATHHLAHGGVVALLIDHSTAERSAWAQFLGVDAPHSMTADRLQARSGAPALWVCSRRSPDGRYEVIAERLDSYTERCIQERTRERTQAELQLDISPIRVDLSRDNTEDSLNVKRHENEREPADVIRLSRAAHAHLTTLISEDPTQWLWVHDRWRPRDHNRARQTTRQTTEWTTD